jgi:uncharacterized integral membrane protein
MKLVKIFGGLVLVLLALFFFMRNTDLVTVDLVFKEYPNVQVAVVMLGAISIGMIIGYGVAVTNILSSKASLRSLKAKNKTLSDELNDLRNVAIDEGIYETEDGEA